MTSQIISAAIPALGMLFLILDSHQAVISATAAIELCLRTVIPSLFPFMFLSAWLRGSGKGNWMLSVFLGGYPVGAQAIGSSGMDRSAANRLLAWCSQAGPSFIFGIAASQFPGLRYGWYLWAIQILSALSVGWIFSGLHGMTTAFSQKGMDLSSAMQASLRAMASVCGWVVIFRVILGFLHRWVFFFLPDWASLFLSGMLELTNGCFMLNQVDNVEIRFLMCLIFLNFGGVCVILQTISVAGGLDIRYYLAGKVLQTGFALMYGCLFFGHWEMMLPLIPLWCGILFGKTRKNSSIPVRVGV